MKIVFNQKNKLKVNTGKYTHCYVQADTGFLGSDANLAILIATSLVMFAGRQGLAPTANRPATRRLQLENRFIAGLKSGDPASFTAVDVLAYGAMGHIIAVGVYLGTVGAVARPEHESPQILVRLSS